MPNHTILLCVCFIVGMAFVVGVILMDAFLLQLLVTSFLQVSPVATNIYLG